ncbi:MAG: 2-C-methyl-D-erythritol 4-phosphate cytidylyltransferase [Acidobacteriota bacterium]|jgi:2-C-methyl-D-erythritol 4-phosphate cytidylyltransferase/2-C-methyl-D-erythritol 2,4-cyclodiphosphate synthase
MPSSDLFIDVVLAAAGAGTRLGADVPKAFVEIDGTPLLRRALDTARAAGARHTVVTVPAQDAPRWVKRVDALGAGASVRGVAGGRTRQESVLLGLKALRAEGGTAEDPAHVVLVHDAARPCASVDLWRRVAAEAARTGGAIPVLPSVDTLKEIAPDGAVVRTLERARVVRAQTPQGFRFDQLLAAHLEAQAGGVEATDDAALFELAGRRVVTVAGEEGNVKVTHPEDLDRVARSRDGAGPSLRVGYGYDVHPLVNGRRLVLGGVVIEHDRGLDGHSDADALAHAVTDALLGAAGLGDIGQKFPAEDARWKNADSIELLAIVVADLRAAGFRPRNVDATILAEQPRLRPHLETMRRRVAGALRLGLGAVNVKATRGEGMGPIGRGEGIAAHAVATVTSD